MERWRYRFVPDRLIGEILTKRWIDSAIPFTVLVVVLGVIAWLLPSMFQPSSLVIAARQLGEFGLVCLAMMVVVIAGGIDLSVSSNFALGNFLGALFAQSRRLAGVGDDPGRGRGLRAGRPLQRHPDRLSQAARLPDDAGDVDHRARVGRHPAAANTRRRCRPASSTMRSGICSASAMSPVCRPALW